MRRRACAARDPAAAAVRRAGGAVVELLEARRLLSFGVTATSTTYTIDNGTDLRFTVLKNGAATSSTVHLGDVTSIQYKGHELLATYAQTSRYSHYEQGLGGTAQISYTIGGNNSWILVTCDDSAASSGGVIQYYAVRKGDDNLYMASLPTDVHNGPGEGRFIAYLSKSVFTNPEKPSDLDGNTGAIEGSDVFGFADGTTASKFYNMGRRMIDNVYHGLTGSAGGQSVGAWMFMGDREHSAGGPFFKDIDYQTTGGATEIYNCLFTGHTQTEAFRQGLQGPYALQLTGGSAPAQPDYSWMEQLNLQGWIPASQRGTLTGTASGVAAGHEVTVALSNSTAQYWGTPDATGKYTISGIQPGTYTETLYDTELAVGTRTVTITAGHTTAADVADTYYTPTPIWRIGTWDGTPAGFLNADRISIMHPSDTRMNSWTATPNFVIGTNTDDQWPMAQFMGVNNGQRITFNLTSAQAATPLTLRIGITLGFAGGRNRVTVNAGQSYAWTSSIPAASIDLNSRGVTRGTWRGDNQVYTYSIPTSALRAGQNTIDLPVVSGSYVSGQTWLSPNVVYDAIDLVPTSSLTNAPQVKTITVTPASPSVQPGGAVRFTAVAKDQFGNVTPANVTWSATGGTIDDTGAFVAPAGAGPVTVTATSGSVAGSTAVNVDNTPPTLTSASFDDNSQTLSFNFSEDVLASLSAADFVVTRLADGSTVPAGDFTFAAQGGPGVPSGATLSHRSSASPLADGNYRVSIQNISDAAGNAMAPATFDFFVLTGDANHDRYVDAADQAIVTADMGKSGMTFAQGDFNGDGKVDAADQAILDAAWHTYLPAPDGDVAVPQGAGDTNYVLKLEVGGGLVDVWNGGSTTAPPLYRIPVTALSSLSLTGGSGNDALTVDLSNGNPLPAGGATFDGGAGANGLRVIGGPGDDAVTLGAASLSIGGRTVRVANTTSFQFPGGSGGSDLIYVSAGTWQVDADTPTGTPNVSLLVSGGATAVSLASGQHLANLAISDGTVTMAAPGAALSVSGSLTINGVGTLDLGSGSLLAPSANVATYVQRAAGAPLPSGMNAWTGPGLTNSLVRADAANGNAEALAVGYFDSRDDAQTGLSVPDGYTLVKVTVYGDATGDGVNDTADFTVWRNNFFKGNRWSQGDFNYDGVVDTADFTVWRNHFYDAVGGVSSDAAAQVVPAATVAPVVPMATTKSAPQPAHCRRLAPWRRVARQRRAETLQAEPSAARRHGAG